MKVIRAKSAGFCWGVERAIQVAREQADGGILTFYTDWTLIYNNQMMTALGREGVREVGDYRSSSSIELDEGERDDSVVVVRAHGISPERRKYLKGLDLPFKDATCPDVGIIAGKVRHTVPAVGYLFKQKARPKITREAIELFGMDHLAVRLAYKALAQSREHVRLPSHAVPLKVDDLFGQLPPTRLAIFGDNIKTYQTYRFWHQRQRQDCLGGEGEVVFGGFC